MPQLCLNTFPFSPFAGTGGGTSLPELLDAVRGAGFTALSLDSFTLQAWAEQGHDRADVARRIADAGLRAPELLGLVVSEDEASTLEGARQAAELVAAFDARFVLTMVTVEPDERCAELFARAAWLISEAGAKAAVEFVPFSPVNSIAAARTLVAAAGTDHAGILVDNWHLTHGPSTFEELAQLPGEEIAYVQVDDHPEVLGADADFYTECMTRRMMPGDGAFDLPAFRDALAATGFDGLISAEVISAELAALGPAEFARRAHAALTRYWPAAADGS